MNNKKKLFFTHIVCICLLSFFTPLYAAQIKRGFEDEFIQMPGKGHWRSVSPKIQNNHFFGKNFEQTFSASKFSTGGAILPFSSFSPRTKRHPSFSMRYLEKDANALSSNETPEETKLKQRFSELHLACLKGDLEDVKKSLALGAEIDERTLDSDGYTPLIMAIRKDSLEIVQELIQNGANVNKPDSHGTLPIYYAIDQYRMTEPSSESSIKNYLLEGEGISLELKPEDIKELFGEEPVSFPEKLPAKKRTSSKCSSHRLQLRFLNLAFSMMICLLLCKIYTSMHGVLRTKRTALGLVFTPNGGAKIY